MAYALGFLAGSAISYFGLGLNPVPGLLIGVVWLGVLLSRAERKNRRQQS